MNKCPFLGIPRSSPARNLEVLDDMLSARYELARHLGASSHAEFAVTPQVAGSPQAVCDFLERLSVGLRPQVKSMWIPLGSREPNSGPPINSGPPRFSYLPVL